MNRIEKLGAVVWHELGELHYAAAVIGTALIRGLNWRNWKLGGGAVFARQISAVGTDPLLFVCGVAFFVGVSVVLQLALWTGRAGQSQLLGPLLVAVVVRELAPIMTNIVVIVRSSSAMATELGLSKASGEVDQLTERGADPFLHIVMPRILAMCISTVCLTLVFIVVAFATGYILGAWFGTGTRDIWSFNNTVITALRPTDMLSALAKSVLPGLFTAACCCISGLSVQQASDIPRATQQALSRSIAGLFVISGVVSLLMYF